MLCLTRQAETGGAREGTVGLEECGTAKMSAGSRTRIKVEVLVHVEVTQYYSIIAFGTVRITD